MKDSFVVNESSWFCVFNLFNVWISLLVEWAQQSVQFLCLLKHYSQFSFNDSFSAVFTILCVHSIPAILDLVLETRHLAHGEAELPYHKPVRDDQQHGVRLGVC